MHGFESPKTARMPKRMYQFYCTALLKIAPALHRLKYCDNLKGSTLKSYNVIKELTTGRPESLCRHQLRVIFIHVNKLYRYLNRKCPNFGDTAQELRELYFEYRALLVKKSRTSRQVGELVAV